MVTCSMSTLRKRMARRTLRSITITAYLIGMIQRKLLPASKMGKNYELHSYHIIGRLYDRCAGAFQVLSVHLQLQTVYSENSPRCIRYQRRELVMTTSEGFIVFEIDSAGKATLRAWILHSDVDANIFAR